MNAYTLSLFVVGFLLLVITLGSRLISRLPLTYALIYLVVGVMLGPYGLHLIQARPDAESLERLTEFIVIVSLFSCGLKMNRPLQLWAWQSTIRLIGFLMPITIFAVAAIAHWFLNLNWGAAILLGAILAPTDPVLASEVQLAHTEDRDELRFGLTSEGGLNDALAFPFVYFGLYWLKDNHWQNWFRQWVAVDVIWAIAAGIVMGIVVARCIVWVERKIQGFQAIEELWGDFVALSMILGSYSLTEFVNGYGFLAVFVSGMVAQQSYCRHNPEKRQSQLAFTERIEKLLEIAVIIILGSLLRLKPILSFSNEAVLVGGLLIFVIRPVGAWLSTIGTSFHPNKRFLMGWFGIRGVGSLYYLSYALGEGLLGPAGEEIAWITYITVVISVVLHGISSTPLMNWYESTLKRRNTENQPAIVKP
ncbi:MAG: sodium:proton antiporter [Leptolyngbyaceae bacterium]|nr:sodium:proton antiporter [Leptolyngbyaceae bacterium]